MYKIDILKLYADIIEMQIETMENLKSPINKWDQMGLRMRLSTIEKIEQKIREILSNNE